MVRYVNDGSYVSLTFQDPFPRKLSGFNVYIREKMHGRIWNTISGVKVMQQTNEFCHLFSCIIVIITLRRARASSSQSVSNSFVAFCSIFSENLCFIVVACQPRSFHLEMNFDYQP